MHGQELRFDDDEPPLGDQQARGQAQITALSQPVSVAGDENRRQFAGLDDCEWDSHEQQRRVGAPAAR